MRIINVFLLVLFITTIPSFAQNRPSTEDLIAKMKTTLDLQDDQVANITPVIAKYANAYKELQESINTGSINPQAINTQRQGIEDQETQEISQYLKPNQLNEWRQMQNEMDHQQNNENDQDNADTDSDKYSNLPQNNLPQR